ATPWPPKSSSSAGACSKASWRGNETPAWPESTSPGRGRRRTRRGNRRRGYEGFLGSMAQQPPPLLSLVVCQAEKQRAVDCPKRPTHGAPVETDCFRAASLSAGSYFSFHSLNSPGVSARPYPVLSLELKPAPAPMANVLPSGEKASELTGLVCSGKG